MAVTGTEPISAANLKALIGSGSLGGEKCVASGTLSSGTNPSLSSPADGASVSGSSVTVSAGGTYTLEISGYVRAHGGTSSASHYVDLGVKIGSSSVAYYFQSGTRSSNNDIEEDVGPYSVTSRLDAGQKVTFSKESRNTSVNTGPFFSLTKVGA